MYIYNYSDLCIVLSVLYIILCNGARVCLRSLFLDQKVFKTNEHSVTHVSAMQIHQVFVLFQGDKGSKGETGASGAPGGQVNKN